MLRPHLARLRVFLIRESTVGVVIVVNAIALVAEAFPGFPASRAMFWIDYCCLLFFIMEAALKIRQPDGFAGYWSEGWNRLDLYIVIGSLPLLASPVFAGYLENAAFVMLLRLGRLFRFARLLRLVPDAAKIWSGVQRALSASVYIFLMLFVLNVILAMGANMLFGNMEQASDYFGDPLKSLYSIFKVFTIEGWYEIPDRLAARGVAPGTVLLLRFYFTFAVLAGGLLGLSIANAVFVDSMVSDNTDEVERMVTELREELKSFREDVLKKQHGT